MGVEPWHEGGNQKEPEHRLRKQCDTTYGMRRYRRQRHSIQSKDLETIRPLPADQHRNGTEAQLDQTRQCSGTPRLRPVGLHGAYTRWRHGPRRIPEQADNGVGDQRWSTSVLRDRTTCKPALHHRQNRLPEGIDSRAATTAFLTWPHGHAHPDRPAPQSPRRCAAIPDSAPGRNHTPG